MADNLPLPQILLSTAIAAELAHPPTLKLVAALRGISRCATACGCCSLHRQIAREAVAEWERATAESGSSS